MPDERRSSNLATLRSALRLIDVRTATFGISYTLQEEIFYCNSNFALSLMANLLSFKSAYYLIFSNFTMIAYIIISKMNQLLIFKFVTLAILSREAHSKICMVLSCRVLELSSPPSQPAVLPSPGTILEIDPREGVLSHPCTLIYFSNHLWYYKGTTTTTTHSGKQSLYCNTSLVL